MMTVSGDARSIKAPANLEDYIRFSGPGANTIIPAAINIIENSSRQKRSICDSTISDCQKKNKSNPNQDKPLFMPSEQDLIQGHKDFLEKHSLIYPVIGLNLPPSVYENIHIPISKIPDGVVIATDEDLTRVESCANGIPINYAICKINSAMMVFLRPDAPPLNEGDLIGFLGGAIRSGFCPAKYAWPYQSIADLYVNGSPQGNFTRYIKHAINNADGENTANLRVCEVYRRDPEDAQYYLVQLGLVACKKILPGEQFVYNYGKEYFKDTQETGYTPRTYYLTFSLNQHVPLEGLRQLININEDLQSKEMDVDQVECSNQIEQDSLTQTSIPEERGFSMERILCHDNSLPYSALNGRDCGFKHPIHDEEMQMLIYQYNQITSAEEREQFIPKINQRRKQLHLPVTEENVLNLSDLDLSSLYLSDITIDLIERSDLSDATLVRCNFSNGQITKCIISGTTFSNCLLQKTKFLNTAIENSFFVHCPLQFEGSSAMLNTADEFLLQLKQQGAQISAVLPNRVIGALPNETLYADTNDLALRAKLLIPINREDSYPILSNDNLQKLRWSNGSMPEEYVLKTDSVGREVLCLSETATALQANTFIALFAGTVKYAREVVPNTALPQQKAKLFGEVIILNTAAFGNYTQYIDKASDANSRNVILKPVRLIDPKNPEMYILQLAVFSEGVILPGAVLRRT